MPSAIPLANRPTRLSAFLLAALLAGCSYLIYIPMLIIVPFMPLIQLAVKLGARYGPLLLMLVEADPHGTHFSPGMIAAGPPHALRASALPTLEQQILTEVQSNEALRAIVLVEIAKLTPDWLEQQQYAARARGESLRIAFVDSRNLTVSDHVRRACANAGIPLTGTPGLAQRIASGTPFTCPQSPTASTAHAALLAALAHATPPHSLHPL